jgi:hypothetical protein
MPIEIQGRVFAAQVVLTNLASIPPILLAGTLSTVLPVEAVLIAALVVLSAIALWAVAQASLRSSSQAHA